MARCYKCRLRSKMIITFTWVYEVGFELSHCTYLVLAEESNMLSTYTIKRRHEYSRSLLTP